MNGLVGLTSDTGAGGDIFQAADIAAAAALAMPVDGHMAQLSCCTIAPFQYIAIRDHSPADAGTNGQIDHVAAASACTKHIFAQSGSIGVIFNENRDVKLLCEDIAQGNMVPTG